jgi:hypothetical protein
VTLYTNQIYPFLKQDTCKFVRSVQSTLYSLFNDTTYITGEATATEINLPVGDPENNYTIYLRVFICGWMFSLAFQEGCTPHW